MRRFFVFLAFIFVLASIDMLWNPSGNGWAFLCEFFFVDLLFVVLTIRVERVTIKAKAVERAGWGKIKRYVFKTDDGRILLNVPYWFKFNTLNLWKKIKVGNTYRIKTMRLLFFRNAYNILSATEIKTNKKRIVKKSK